MTALILKSLSMFGAGILASLSPCVYPMIPITIGFFGSQSSTKRSFKILAFVIGQVLAFSLLAIIAVKTGRSFGFSSQSFWINLILGLFILVAGIYSYKNKLPKFLENFNGFNKLSKTTNSGILGALILGAGTALLASPCTTPVLSGILALLSESRSFVEGLLLMLFYSIGFSLLIVLIAVGILNTNKLPKSGKWLNKIHMFSSFLLIGLGIYYLVKAFMI